MRASNVSSGVRSRVGFSKGGKERFSNLIYDLSRSVAVKRSRDTF